MSLSRQIKPTGEAMPETISTGEYRPIELQAIRLDQSAQPRESLNTERTAEYAEAMTAGDKFPSLVVFFDGETYWLADGFHRHYAAQQAGIKALSCRVLPGGLRDAILYSVGANAKHGLARSDEDKKRAVMRLLDDAEWSTWTDRDIAKRCHVSHPFVAKVRKAHAGDTGSVSSMERTYVHPKTRKPTTMKTAGINAGRTQFQAKTSEDNGSITGGAGAVTGEASRLASGRTDAGEAASVSLPTIPRNIVAEVRELWNLATPTERGEIRAIINSEVGIPASIVLMQEPHVEAEGQGRVREHRRGEGSHPRLPSDPVENKTGGPSVIAAEPILPSTVPTVEPEATPSPPPASGNPFYPDPHYPLGATAVQEHQVPKLSGAKSDAPHIVGQGCAKQMEHFGHSGQEDASAAQARNEPGSASGATVTQFINPVCQKPDTCKWAHSQASCSVCANAAIKARAA